MKLKLNASGNETLNNVRRYLDLNPGNFTWQQYIDVIERSPSLVQAINAWGEHGSIKVEGRDLFGISYLYKNRSLTLTESSLNNPTQFAFVLAHEAYGHDRTRDFMSSVVDPNNPLYQGRNTEEIKRLVTQGCFTAETISFVAEHGVAEEISPMKTICRKVVELFRNECHMHHGGNCRASFEVIPAFFKFPEMNKMNTPNSIFFVFLKVLTGLACTLSSISYAQSDTREVLSNSFKPSSSSNDVDFRREFAKSIHKIIQDGLAAEEISKEFKWRVLEEKKFEETGPVATTFDLYRRTSNPRLTYFPKVNRSNFIVQLLPEYICLRSEDVIGEFGKNYQSLIANVDTWKDSSLDSPKKNLSEAIEKNRKLFFLGPRYEIRLGHQIYSASFYFGESECATMINIQQQD